MFIVTAKVEAWEEDFPGSRVKWVVGQSREVHDSLVDKFRNNPAAWTVSGGSDSSPMQVTKTVTGGSKFSNGMLADLFAEKVIPLVSISSPSDASAVTCVRNSTATYFDANGILQTAAINTPVFEYDPVTKALLGLRNEEERTNSALWSEDYNNAAWSKSTVTVAASTEVSPDGVGVFQSLTEAASGTLSQSVSITAGRVVTQSFFAKRGNHDWIRSSIADFTATSNAVVAWFNLATGQVGFVSASPTGGATQVVTVFGASINDCGNGVYRCSMWGIIPTSTQVTCYAMSADKNKSTTRNGNGSFRYQWGHQIEVAAASEGPTSYIKTTTAAVTRSADVLTVPVENVGAVAVTYLRQRPLTANYSAGYPVVFSLDDGSANNSVVLDGSFDTSGSVYAERLTVTSGGTAQPSVSIQPSANTKSFNALVSLSPAEFYVNGRSALASLTIPTGLKTLRLGNNFARTRAMNGYITSIAAHPNLTIGNRQYLGSVTGLSPVAPNATAETKALLNYLADTDVALMCHVIRTTRATGDNDDRITNLLTGGGFSADYPVMYGYTLSEWRASSTAQTIDININLPLIETIKKLFQKGRVITLHDNMPNFLTGGDAYDKNNYCLRQCVPGGAQHSKLNVYLDGICNVLDSLVVSGVKVPVLLRLFRESRMGTYWWSNYDVAGDGQSYAPDADIVTVYRHSINYIKARCSNALFVYCAGCPNGGIIPANGMTKTWYNAVYPGHDVIDIITIDPYHDGANPYPGHLDAGWMTAAINANLSLAKDSGKPWGFAEIGFRYSGRLWDATYATNATIDAAHGYAAPTSFWDGVILNQMQRHGVKPCYIGWWGEEWTPKAGDATAASAVAFLRSPQIALASQIKRKLLYGF